MELKPGYKLTEIGVIPEDWDVLPLADVAEFLDGRRKPIKDTVRATMQGDYPYYGASGIVDYVNGYLFDEDLILLGEDGENILSRNLRLAFRVSGKIWVNNHAHVLRPRTNTEIGYLSEYLESIDYSLYNSGTAQPKLNQKTCSRILVVCPPLVEQRAIAAALSNVDDQIAALDALIAKKRDIKQGAMQELLTGARRLPGFSQNTGFKQTEIGQIPQDWEVRGLNDLGIWKGGGTPSMSDPRYWNNGSIPWVSSGDLKVIRLSGTAYSITDIAIKESSTTLIKTGAILMVMRSGILRKFLPVAINTLPVAINQDIKALIPAKDTYVDYILQALLHYGPDILSTCMKSGTTVESIEFGWLKSYIIPLPISIKEQRAIAIVLSDIDDQIIALEDQREKTVALKQGMMQELLTGNTRLI